MRVATQLLKPGNRMTADERSNGVIFAQIMFSKQYSGLKTYKQMARESMWKSCRTALLGMRTEGRALGIVYKGDYIDVNTDSRTLRAGATRSCSSWAT